MNLFFSSIRCLTIRCPALVYRVSCRFVGLRHLGKLSLCVLTAAICGVSATAQTPDQISVGSAGPDQTVTVTFAAGGKVASIVFVSEGLSNGEFQQSATGSSCVVGTTYSTNNTCTIHYYFAPLYAGLRRGGVLLKNSSGTILATGYISGVGLAPLGVYYPSIPIGSSVPQQILAIPNGIAFDVDGAGNIYVLQQNGSNGPDDVIKNSPNGSGGYTATTIASDSENSLDGGGVTVDGAGDVFYTYSAYPGQGGTCNIYELQPTSTGYSKNSIWSNGSGGNCMTWLKADGAGAIYTLDFDNNIQKFVYNGNSWSSFSIGTVNYYSSGSSYVGIDVDYSGDVFVAIGDSTTEGTQDVLTEFVYNPSTPSNYSQVIDPGVSAVNGNISADGVSVGADGSLFITQDSSILRAVPGASRNYATGTSSTFATLPNIDGDALPIKIDSYGNLYVGYEGGTSTGLYYEIPANNFSMSFGTVNAGSSSGALVASLTNLGTSTLDAYSISVPTPFVQVSNQGTYADCTNATYLAPGGTCSFGLEFSPPSNDSGPYSGNATIVTTSLNGHVSQSIPVAGTAYHPPPTVSSLSPSGGDSNGNQAFTITGTVFSDVTSVVFCCNASSQSSSVSFTINSATQISAASAPGAVGTSETVTVNGPGGSATGTWKYNTATSALRSTLTISQSSVPGGGITPVTATVRDANGNLLVNSTVTFTSSNTLVAASGVATTNSSGVATFVATGMDQGTTVYSATSDGVLISQTASLTVTPAVVQVGLTVNYLSTPVKITAAGTVGSVVAVSEGNQNGDYTVTSNGCSGAYAVGATCTVQYMFGPKSPGLRNGAIVVEDSNGNVLGETFISGVGTAPLAQMTPGVQTTLVSGLNDVFYFVADGAGDVYFLTNSGVVRQSSGGTQTTLATTQYPTTLGIDGAGNIYYGGTENTTSFYMVPNGTGTAKLLTSASTTSDPVYGVMVSDSSGNMYVATSGSGIMKIAAGTYVTSFISVGSAQNETYLTMDPNNNLFFADTNQSYIYEVPSGATTAQAVVTTGLGNVGGLTTDAAGNLYAETGSGLMRLATGTYAQSYVNNIGTYSSGALLRLETLANGKFLYTNGGSIFQVDRTVTPTQTYSSDVSVASSVQTVVVENDGNLNLTISNLSVTPSVFSFSSGSTTCTSSTTLGVGSTPCSIGLVFTPTAATTVSGSATFTQNSLNSSGPMTIPLSGTGYSTQTITFPQPTTPVVPGSTATLTATASSGLPVTYAVTQGQASISGSVITYLGSGTVTITASQSGNANYVAATPVSVSVLVTGTSETVGTTSTSQTATVTITAKGTLQSISVLTQGAPNKDFNYLSGSIASSACTVGATYSANTTCTVTYTFTPSRPGQRLGAVSLINTAGTVFGTVPIGGTGVGPLAIFPDSASVISFTGSTWAYPSAVAVDGFGDLIVADTNHSAVKEIVAVNGVISAGSSVITLASSSLLESPAALAVAGNGDVYVATCNNCANSIGTVYKIVAVNGVVSASSSTVLVATGFNDLPQGLALDASGDLFVSDTQNYQVKEVVAINGAVSTSSTITRVGANNIEQPEGLAVDGSGNVWVADSGFSDVAEIQATNGAVNSNSTVVDYNPTQSGNFSPFGIAIDGNGNVFTVSPGSQAPSNPGQYAAVREILAVNGTISNSSTVLTLASGIQARGIAIDALGHVFAADYNNNLVKEIDLTAAPSMAFPSTSVTAKSAALTDRIENSGNASLSFTGFTASTDFVTDSASTTCSTSTALAAAAICNVGADFAPQAAGSFTGTLTVADNSLYASGAQQQVGLVGTGTTGATSQAVNFTAPPTPVVNGSAPATLTASATSGLPIVFSATGPATISGNVVTYIGAGTVVITAIQAGSGTYAAASAQRTVVVTAAPTGYVASETAVGDPVTGTATVTFTAAATLNPASSTAFVVVTQGSTGLDFNYVTGGTCAVSTAYVSGQACTVNYTFSPLAPGLRSGAIELYDNKGNLVGTSYISGIGDAPLGLLAQGTQSVIGTWQTPRSPFVDAAGNFYITEQYNGSVFKYPGGASPTVLADGLSGVAGMALDGAGNVFYGASGGIYELKGGAGSPITVAALTAPDNNLVIDGAGDIFVTSSNGGLYKIPAGAATATSIIASGASVTGGTLGRTVGMTGDKNGNLFLADYSNNRIYELVYGATALTTLVNADGLLSSPQGIGVDPAGNLYIANSSGSVYKYTKMNGTYTGALVSGAAASAGMFVAPNGDLFVINGGQFAHDKRTIAPTVTFPSTTQNTTSAPQTVGVENDGNALLQMSAVAATAYYTVNDAANTCTASTVVGSGSTCDLGIEFAPTTAGTLTGTATLTSNSMGVAGNVLSVPLTGTAPALSQTITFPQPASPLGYSAVLTETLAATASSNLVVTYSITGPATLNGSVLTFTGVGSVVVTASQAGNASYAAATSVQRTIVVNQGAQTIAFTLPTSEVVYTATVAPLTLAATSSSGLAVSYAVSGPATLSGTTLTATGPGYVSVTASQAGATNYAAAASVTQNFAVDPAFDHSTLVQGSPGAVQTLTIAFPTGITLGSIQTTILPAGGGTFTVLTGGSGGTCSVGTAYAAGAVCTVKMTFTPGTAGIITGALQMLDTTSTVQASVPLLELRYR